VKKSTVVLFFGALAAACHAPPKTVQPLPLEGDWRTLQAEQRLTVDAPRKGGGREHRKLRALIAVERPDKFRLRAFGPGGITLFDLLGVGGRVTVLESLRDPNSPSLRPILESLAGDVAATYGLAEKSTNGRAFSRQGDHAVVRDAEREVRIWPARVEIDNHARDYHVVIESSSQTLDAALDPELFAESPR
jgi:hypothetical protein